MYLHLPRFHFNYNFYYCTLQTEYKVETILKAEYKL